MRAKSTSSKGSSRRSPDSDFEIRLRLAQPAGYLLLGHAGVLPCGSEPLEEALVV